MSVSDLTNIIRDDLEFLGYTVVVSTTPPARLNSNENLIAIRTTASPFPSASDYHLMRFRPELNAWTHKPARTSVLRFLHEPSSRPWINEVVLPNGTVEFLSNV